MLLLASFLMRIYYDLPTDRMPALPLQSYSLSTFLPDFHSVSNTVLISQPSFAVSQKCVRYIGESKYMV